jgi:hypothetical protein
MALTLALTTFAASPSRATLPEDANIGRSMRRDRRARVLLLVH